MAVLILFCMLCVCVCVHLVCPDITVMVDWVLKINYLSICVSRLCVWCVCVYVCDSVYVTVILCVTVCVSVTVCGVCVCMMVCA